jgi:hypothetical protein
LLLELAKTILGHYFRTLLQNGEFSVDLMLIVLLIVLPEWLEWVIFLETEADVTEIDVGLNP